MSDINTIETVYNVFRYHKIPDEIINRILYVYNGLQHPITFLNKNIFENINTKECRCLWINYKTLNCKYEFIECLNCSIKKDSSIPIIYEDIHNLYYEYENVRNDLIECEDCGRIWDGNAQCDCYLFESFL